MTVSVECSLHGDGNVVINEAASFDDSVTEEELSWRLPPDESLSDYIIEVRCRDSCQFVTYHVHKSILAVGPRRSHYFVCTFFNKTTQSAARVAAALSPDYGDAALDVAAGLVEPACGELQRALEMQHLSIAPGRDRTVLEMEELAARAFPVLLDYMYSATGRLDITTENATPLAWLAQHLEIKSLKREVKDFWVKDLCMENLTTYYEHSILFQNEKVLMHANDYCAEHIFSVEESIVVRVLTAIDPFFLLQVMGKVHGRVSSRRLSLLVAVYCNVHRDELDSNIFLQLTSEYHLPTLEVKAAKVLLELEASTCHNRDKLSSLKRRCITVLAQHWDDTCIIRDLPSENESTSTPPASQRVSLPCLAGAPLELFVKLSFLNSKSRLETMDRVRQERDALQDECESLRMEMQRLTQVNRELMRNSHSSGIGGGSMPVTPIGGSGSCGGSVGSGMSLGGPVSSDRDSSPASQSTEFEATPNKE